eukprot:362866-Chlamydomonas_euryale.AAC.13
MNSGCAGTRDTLTPSRGMAGMVQAITSCDLHGRAPVPTAATHSPAAAPCGACCAAAGSVHKMQAMLGDLSRRPGNAMAACAAPAPRHVRFGHPAAVPAAAAAGTSVRGRRDGGVPAAAAVTEVRSPTAALRDAAA